MKILLASSSVARHKLMKNAGFDIIQFNHKSDEILFDESYKKSLLDFVKEVSKLKMNSIDKNSLFEKAEKENLNKFMLLVCDTETRIEQGMVLGKPSSLERAREIFCELNDKKVYIISYFRFKIFEKINNVWEEVSSDEGSGKTILITSWTEEEIDHYIKLKGDSILSISGGFTAEGLGALYVKHIEGSHSNVIGFPLYEFYLKYKQYVD